MTDPTYILLLAFLVLSLLGYVVERNLWHLPAPYRGTIRNMRQVTKELHRLRHVVGQATVSIDDFTKIYGVVEEVEREGEAMVHQALYEQRLREDEAIRKWIGGEATDDTDT